MDDDVDRGYSRPPEVSDLVAVCRSLNAAGARYILIGGFAVILSGFVRTTKDIDVLVDASPENVRRLKAALSTLPDNAAAAVEEGDIERYGVVRVADEVVVDLMSKACGITYEEALAAGVTSRRIDDVEIPLPNLALLIRTKQTFRDSDKADVAFLQRLLDEGSASRE